VPQDSAPIALRDDVRRLTLSFEGQAAQVWKNLREGWERFVAEGAVPSRYGLPDFVLERWRRARERGIDPLLAAAPIGDDGDDFERILVEDDFARAGRRVLDDMVEMLEAQALILSDPRGRILHATGDRLVAEALYRVNARPGGRFGEDDAGPNGIGAALSLGAPMVIFGPEHFCQSLHQFVCQGAPVFVPQSGELLGIVDISGFATRARANLLPLAVSMAHSIEYLLTEWWAALRQSLAEAYEAARSRWPDDALAAFDRAGNLVAATSRWHEIVRPRGDGAWLSARMLAELVESPPSPGEVPLALRRTEPRVTWLHVVRTTGRNAGIIVLLESCERPPRRQDVASDLGPAFEGLIGTAPGFVGALRVAARAAASDETVLITGETGTGKELVARALHRQSHRARKPLVSVNCAALPRELMESELFGYEGGAFTGARRDGKPGRFELADGGTLFLDEIADLPLDMQAKLLRVLEECAVLRVGGSQPRSVDVRIVAATNCDLSRAVAAGKFRSDLFYRLAVIEISLPPLRSRGSDVTTLARAFLERSCERAGRRTLRLLPEVEQILLKHAWPGNVRELRNVMARLAMLVDAEVVTAQDLPPALLESESSSAPPPVGSLHEIEDDVIRRTLEACGGNVSEVARRLRIHRTTVYRCLRRFRSSGTP